MKKKEKTSISKAIKIVFLLLPLLLFTGLRSENTGIDTVAYKYEYISAQNGSPFERPTEPLFTLFVTACANLGLSFSGFLLIQASLYYLSLAHVALATKSKNSFIYISTIISLGLFSFGLSGIRQSLAMTVFFFSISLLIRGRVLWYLFASLVAFLIHNSSIVPFALLLLAHNAKLNFRFYFFILIITPIFYFVADNSLISHFSFFDIKQIQSFDVDSDQLLSPKVPLAAYLLATLVLFLIGTKEDIGELHNSTQTIHLLLWGTIFTIGFFWLATSVRLADRIGFYFIPFFSSLSTIPFGRIKHGIFTATLLLAMILILFVSSIYSIQKTLG